jgi:hypothetical protein
MTVSIDPIPSALQSPLYLLVSVFFFFNKIKKIVDDDILRYLRILS